MRCERQVYELKWFERSGWLVITMVPPSRRHRSRGGTGAGGGKRVLWRRLTFVWRITMWRRVSLCIPTLRFCYSFGPSHTISQGQRRTRVNRSKQHGQLHPCSEMTGQGVRGNRLQVMCKQKEVTSSFEATQKISKLHRSLGHELRGLRKCKPFQWSVHDAVRPAWLTIDSTMLGSASVERSPNESPSPAEILRRMRRMI